MGKNVLLKRKHRVFDDFQDEMTAADGIRDDTPCVALPEGMVILTSCQLPVCVWDGR